MTGERFSMIYFILGSHPELSIAELKAVLGREYRPVFVSESVVVIEPIDRNLGELQERLGGIVKVGRVAGELKAWNKIEAADLVASLASGAAGKNKISFGLSVYDLGNKKATRFLERDLDQLGLEVKTSQRSRSTCAVRERQGAAPVFGDR